MIPAHYQLAAKAGGVLLLMALAAGVVWWGLAPRIDIEARRADKAQADLGKAEQLIELQAGVLAQQQKTLGDLADIERRMQQLGQVVARNHAALCGMRNSAASGARTPSVYRTRRATARRRWGSCVLGWHLVA